MTLSDKINDDLKEAMKAREKEKLEALRNIKKVIIEAKSSKGAGSELDDEEVLKIISKLAKQGSESAVIYKQQGRTDLYEQEMFQVAVFESYLPAKLSAERQRRRQVERMTARDLLRVGAADARPAELFSGEVPEVRGVQHEGLARVFARGASARREDALAAMGERLGRGLGRHEQRRHGAEGGEDGQRRHVRAETLHDGAPCGGMRDLGRGRAGQFEGAAPSLEGHALSRASRDRGASRPRRRTSF